MRTNAFGQRAAALAATILTCLVCVVAVVDPAPADAIQVPPVPLFTPIPTQRLASPLVGINPVVVPVAGKLGIPVDATSLVVNVEVYAPTSPGYVRITPAGQDSSVSLQEFKKGQAISTQATVGLHDGAVQVRVSAGTARIFLDVSGYYSNNTGSFYRPSYTGIGIGNPVVGTQPVVVQVAGAGRPLIPLTATAIALNFQVRAPTVAGYLRVTPAGQDSATAAQVFAKGQTISNTVVVALHNGAIQLKLSAGAVRAYLTVQGYYDEAGDYYRSLPTQRVGAVTAGVKPVQLPVAGRSGVPATADAAVVHVEVYAPTAGGYVTVNAATIGTADSMQEFQAGDTISIMVIVPLHNGAIEVKVSAGTAKVFVDVAGYFSFTLPPDVTPPAPVTGLTAAATATTVALSWTNPVDDLYQVNIRRAVGSVPPASATAGTKVADANETTTSLTDSGLTPGTQYSYSLFATDGANYASPASATVTTTSVAPGGCTTTWTGATSDDWATASNWSVNSTPTITDWACIPSGASNVPVQISGRSVYLAGLTNDGGLTLTAGAIGMYSSVAKSTSTGWLQVNGSVVQSTHGLDVSGDHAYFSDSRLDGSMTILSGTAARMYGSATFGCKAGFAVTDGTLVNNGTLLIGVGNQLSTTETSQVINHGTIQLQSNASVGDCGSGANSVPPLTNAVDGTVTVGGAWLGSIHEWWRNDGSVSVPAGADLTLADKSDVTSTAVFSGDGAIVIGGVLRVPSGANVTMSNFSGTGSVELDGTSNLGQISATGAYSVGGLSLVMPALNPLCGASVTAVSGGSASGGWSSISSATLPVGGSWQLVSTASSAGAQVNC